MLRNKPIQLSSAVLDLGSGGQGEGTAWAQELQGKHEQIKVLNLTANSRLSGDGGLPANRRQDFSCIFVIMD